MARSDLSLKDVTNPEKSEAIVLGLTMCIFAEADRASKKFDRFNSAHEGYAVLKEEVDELWDDIKANKTKPSLKEAVQVGAMALRYLTDVGSLEDLQELMVEYRDYLK